MLFDELAKIIFYSNGTTYAEHQYIDVPMSLSYNEPDNVTCTVCGWSVHDHWTYPWLKKTRTAGTAALQHFSACTRARHPWQ